MEALKAIYLQPGFGFHPTDAELISHYLKRKNQGLKVDLEVIPELDIYKHEPWDLPACCQIPTRDNKWHFFASRDRKYPNGLRSNRATEAGYWKSTGKDRNIKSHNRVIGTKKTLVFHEGRPPYGKRTDWIMHEYHLEEKESKTSSGMKATYVLCRVTKRNGFVVEGEHVSAQAEEADDCQNTVKSVIQEESSRSGSTENLDEWFEELFDPDFDGSICFNVPSLPSTESRNEPQVSQTGFSTLIPKDESLDFDFLPEEIIHILHDDPTTAMPKINELLAVNHNATSSPIQFNKFGAEEFNKEMLDLSKNTKFNGIQIQEHRGIPAIGTFQHSVKFQVQTNKIESRSSASVSQTISTKFNGIQIQEHRGIPAIGTFQHSVKLQVQTNKIESRSSASVSQTIKFAHVDHQISTNCSKPRRPLNLKVEKKRELIQNGIKELSAMVKRFFSCV